MARRAWIASLSALALMALAGCAENALVLQGRLQQSKQQQESLARQNQQLAERNQSLEKINRDWTTQLALSQQQTRLAEEHLTAVNEQLRTLTAQLDESRKEQQSSDQKAQALAPRCTVRPGCRSAQTTVSCRRCRSFSSPASTCAATAT